MAACLTLLFSFDKTQIIQRAPFSVKLTTFMQSLFGTQTFESQAHQYRSSYDANLTDLWDNGYVFFTHFIRLNTEIDELVLRNAWNRGCALVAAPNTAHFHFAIPVVVGEKLKCLLIKFANRQNDRMDASLRKDATQTMTKARKSLLRKGVDASALIYMALRTKSASSVAFDLMCAKRRGYSTENGRQEKTPSGYVVLACGLDENIYPGLTREEDDCREIATALRNLLSTKDDSKTAYQRSLLTPRSS